MKKPFTKISVWFSVISALALFPVIASAATLTLLASPAHLRIGEPVTVSVVLDTSGEAVNAIKGEIDFPAGQFSLENVESGGSPISFWVEAPHEIGSGTIAFSGIMPGGFSGVANPLFSVVLVPSVSGEASIALNKVDLLRNDGQGSAIATTVNPAAVTVSSEVASGTILRPVSFIAPDPFTPVIGQDPDVYGGAYFLAFSTTDEGSGIDHYEVLEVSGGAAGGGSVASWVVATSPYRLTDQSLSSDIYVRAVDHAGNFIIVTLAASRRRLSLSSISILVVAGAYLVALGWFLLRRRRA